MAQWVGAQGQVKVAKNTYTYGISPWKPLIKNKNFFSISTTRLAESVESLISSSARNVVFAGLKGLKMMNNEKKEVQNEVSS